jgi:SAM-dependent methyltransferase
VSAFEFDPSDPFPLMCLEEYHYRSAQLHAQRVDAWLGLEPERVEHTLSSTHERVGQWVGLHPDALQTPYTEIRLMLHLLDLKSGDSIVDLGAGYGRMGFVVGRHYPHVSFTGYEISRERVEAGNIAREKFHFRNVKLLEQDITHPRFQIPLAKAYFIYDFGTRKNIQQVIEGLKHISRSQRMVVIGRGRATRDRIERMEPWLSQIVQPAHYGNFSIYRSS